MKKGIIKECKACGIGFYVPKYREDTAKFCSINCQNHIQHITKLKICEGCKKEFKVSNSRGNKKFCTMECRSLITKSERQRRAENRALSKLKRGSNSSRNLKKIVKLVKDLKCEYCKYDKREYNLDIHHIDEDPTNNKIDNLSVLCAMCHRDYHKGNLIYKNSNYYEK